MRSVQIEASAHHSLRRSPPVASVSCLALSGTAETSACSIPDLTHSASCPPSLRPVLLPGRLAVRLGCGNMKALTPGRLTPAPRSLRLHRIALPTFHPQPRELSAGRFAVVSAPTVLPGFATNEQARHELPPKQVRHPTDCRFVSGCSPPRLARAWLTQLPSTTELRHPPARTCTALTLRLRDALVPAKAGTQGLRSRSRMVSESNAVHGCTSRHPSATALMSGRGCDKAAT